MASDNYLVISLKDPMSLLTLTAVIAEIELSLAALKTMAQQIDFNNKEQRQRYRDNLTHLKRFYERAERMALDERAS